MKNNKHLPITNDFMFGKVMENPEIYRQVLEIILARPVEKVMACSTQETMKEHVDSHGIRMDAYMLSETAMYNTEMQMARKGEVKFRSRYNGSMMDINDLKPGQKYETIRNSYVIFICGFDPQDRGDYKYEFITQEVSDRSQKLEEGVYKIFINLKGEHGDISRELKELIDYMAGRLKAMECKQELIREIDKLVMDANKDKEWRMDSMKLEREMLWREACGEARGEARGENRGIHVLIDTLSSMGVTLEEAITKASEQFGKTIPEIQKIIG